MCGGFCAVYGCFIIYLHIIRLCSYLYIYRTQHTNTNAYTNFSNICKALAQLRASMCLSQWKRKEKPSRRSSSSSSDMKTWTIRSVLKRKEEKNSSFKWPLKCVASSLEVNQKCYQLKKYLEQSIKISSFFSQWNGFACGFRSGRLLFWFWKLCTSRARWYDEGMKTALYCARGCVWCRFHDVWVPFI